MSRFVSDLKSCWNDRPIIWYGEAPFCAGKAPIPSDACVLVLGPHPDDPEGVAVTCRLLGQRGCEIHYVLVTMSPSGVEDEYAHRFKGSVDTSLTECKKEIRRREQALAAGMFGLGADRVRFLNLDGKEGETGLDAPENHAEIADALRRIEPDIVIMPTGNDSNATHAWVYRAFRRAVEGLMAARKKPVVALYNEDPKTTKIRKDLFVLFGEEGAGWKGDLLRAHDSQQERNIRVRGTGFDERILQMNRRSHKEIPRAAAAGVSEPFGSASYAEAFEIELFEHSV